MDETKLLPCPECGSPAVTDVLVSTRPFCNSCGFWAPPSWGSKEESRALWNKMSIARHGLRNEVPRWGKELQDRVKALEDRLRPTPVQKIDKPGPES